MIEVLKQLVEASEELSFAVRSKGVIKTVKALSKTKEAIQVGKQAIAQLALDAKADNARELGLDYYEQEPVAWMDADGNVSDNNDHKCFPIPLYTHPPQRTWVGLTDEEVFEICNSNYNRDSELVKMVEAKLKQKNT
jgi:hypothetical protein